MIRKLLAAIFCLFTGCQDNNAPQSAPSGEDSDEKERWADELVWLEPGDPKNPFDYEVLDCRSVALGFTAATSDQSIAESFNRLRTDDGRSSVGTLPEDSFSVDADLRFPYNGAREDGVIFFAKEMEDKWDFYAYDSRLYIRRSWTGALLYVAELRYTDSEVIVEKIHSDRETVYENSEYARAHLQFLITTHFGSAQMPFPTPPGIEKSERKDIALIGFSTYGRRAQFAAELDKKK